MSQDSNTTNDSNPKPRLTVVRGSKPPETPAGPDMVAPAGNNPAELPRLSFSPKKRAEEAPPPPPPPRATHSPIPGETSPGLKRPPSGTRLVPANDLVAAHGNTMPPLNPARGVTPAPFPVRAKPTHRHHVALLALLGVLVFVVGGESTYILIHDEEAAQENKQKPAVVVSSGASSGKPIEVSATSGPAPTPAAAFLQNLNAGIASGARPRLFINSQTFYIGEIVAPEYGLKWTQINDQTRELEFVDKEGRRYVKKF